METGDKEPPPALFVRTDSVNRVSKQALINTSVISQKPVVFLLNIRDLRIYGSGQPFFPQTPDLLHQSMKARSKGLRRLRMVAVGAFCGNMSGDSAGDAAVLGDHESAACRILFDHQVAEVIVDTADVSRFLVKPSAGVINRPGRVLLSDKLSQPD